MKRKVGLLLSLLLLVSCDNHKPTKLIILLVGDQMRPDHLSRFESLYTGGFKWLLENSVVFDSAYHSMAIQSLALDILLLVQESTRVQEEFWVMNILIEILAE